MTNNQLSPSTLVNSARSNDARTANNAVTHSTSLSAIVDLFFVIAASRTMSVRDLTILFMKAFIENPILAIKCLFWARDVREGAGERRVFRILYAYLRNMYSKRVDMFYLDTLIAEYGRWDDVWKSCPNDCPSPDGIAFLYEELTVEKNGLLAKWLPRKGKVFEALRKHGKHTPKEMRKILVSLSSTVEQQMSAKKFHEIVYPHVPSIAMHKYRKAFNKRDAERYKAYLEAVKKGDQKINAGVIFPHTLVKGIFANYGKPDDSILAQWNALPNYLSNTGDVRLLPICDVSGSMMSNGGLPLYVSIALGLYISERNEGIFKDAFVTFSGNPTMEYLKGDLFERCAQLRTAHWMMNTNLQATFTMLLKTAQNNNIPEADMPTILVIISDMEFDRCVSGGTNFSAIEKQYQDAGYKLPTIVFWNVNGRLGNVPVQFKQKGVALISGFSPTILTDVLSGDIVDPEAMVLKVLNKPRYMPLQKCLINP